MTTDERERQFTESVANRTGDHGHDHDKAGGEPEAQEPCKVYIATGIGTHDTDILGVFTTDKLAQTECNKPEHEDGGYAGVAVSEYDLQNCVTPAEPQESCSQSKPTGGAGEIEKIFPVCPSWSYLKGKPMKKCEQVNMLFAEIARLEDENQQWQDAIKAVTEHRDRLEAEASRTQAIEKELNGAQVEAKAALDKFGSHRRGCPAYYGHSGTCTCGLDKAKKGK